MKTIWSLLIIVLFASGISNGQNVPVIKFDTFEKLTQQQNDTTYVINFWATWCKPCVAELPAFEQLTANNKNTKMKVILISLDFKRDLDAKLKKFVSEKNIQSQVYLLDELNYNSWIDKVDPSWGGSIPATLIINNDKKYRKFYEREFTFDELNQAVNTVQ